SGGTIAVAVAAVTVFVSNKDLHNPEISLTKNGLSLILVFVSALALALSLPTELGTPIGWATIAVTMGALGPIWKSEAQAAEEIRDLELEILRLQNEVKNRKATIGKKSLLTKQGNSKGNKR
ncbi:hypothetical protein, partial [Arthrobacter phoenicis]